MYEFRRQILHLPGSSQSDDCSRFANVLASKSQGPPRFLRAADYSNISTSFPKTEQTRSNFSPNRFISTIPASTFWRNVSVEISWVRIKLIEERFYLFFFKFYLSMLNDFTCCTRSYFTLNYFQLKNRPVSPRFASPSKRKVRQNPKNSLVRFWVIYQQTGLFHVTFSMLLIASKTWLFPEMIVNNVEHLNQSVSLIRTPPMIL